MGKWMTIIDSLERLADDGAQNILIMNLPNVGATPRWNGSPDSYEEGETRSITFNLALDSALLDFIDEHPGVTTYTCDIYALFNEIIEHPGLYGFSNVDSTNPNFGVSFDNSDSYLFWDDEHPTTEAHRLIADHVNLLLKNDPDQTDTRDCSGWWYIPGKSGTGIGVEVQNNKLFVAWYAYDSQGRAVWYTAEGSLNGIHFSGNMYRWLGWPLGEDYVTPQREQIGEIGIMFSGTDQALFFWNVNGNQGQETIAKFLDDISPGPADPRDIHGWWYDPSFNGMGFFIESRGGTLFMAWYHYREDGTARWFSSGGAFPEGSTTYSGQYVEWSGGQCVGCTYSVPLPVTLPDALNLQFRDNGTAFMQWNGTAYTLERFHFENLITD